MRERVHQSKPFLWIAIAGYEGAKAKIMVNKKLQNFLPDCYLTELSMPLRSTKAVLAMSNLKSGKTANPLLVSGSLYSSVNFTVPPQPLNGVLGPQFTIKKADDRAEVESVVKKARDVLLYLSIFIIEHLISAELTLIRTWEHPLNPKTSRPVPNPVIYLLG